MRKHGFIVRWLVFQLVLSACVLQARVQPTSGIDVFSTQEEIQAGKEAAAEAKKKLPLLPDSDPIAQYVQSLGQKLVAHAPGEKWPYEFHVVNQREINAFALPGGPIFVNLGTIQSADNEAQLAGVIAHEISHVVQRHGTRAATAQIPTQIPVTILGRIAGKGALTQMAQFGITLGLSPIFLHNSRVSESEADLLGTDIMYDSGYDPHQMAEFFIKLEKEMGKGTLVDQFFSDHPNPGNRAEAVSQEVKTLSPKTYLASSKEFVSVKQRVAGMKPLTAKEIADMQKNGASPSSSNASNTGTKTLEHANYKISYPDDWQAYGDRNTSVTIAPAGGASDNSVSTGVIINTYHPENSSSSLEQATQELLNSLRQSNPDMHAIGNGEDIRVNEVSGKSVELMGSSPIQDSQGHPVKERDWLVTFKRSDGTLLYLVFIAPDKDFGTMRPVFEKMLRSMQLQ
ncbi:MAG TPA: M48 family metallopeptidase [Terriglobales bacterium]